ncbi:DUF6777 domain-containing protein [Streptomyces sp. NPDC086549]|uniref:DUF6777 domain-containing protein n=1 Tax=Streptomyces sp. NPDC086549 TaxID=3365752 RepID=UPI0038125064
MTHRIFSAPVRRITTIWLALALGLGLTAEGCVVGRAVTVVAEAVGYAARTDFMRGALAYGERTLARSTLAKGGEYSGSRAGLYGGSLKTSSCNVRRLLAFLRNPANRKKAEAWAQILGLDPSGIGHFLLHEVTPVLLGNDTLVRNHGYEKGKATDYDSVLQAGMAVLVDIHGVPAVKCNCGNPLTSASTDIHAEIKVEFKGGKWDFKNKRVVKVTATKEPRKSLVLADVHSPDKDIQRPVGADGAEGDQPVQDTDTRTVTVPDLAGQPEDEARAQLESLGLEVVTEGVPDSGQEQGTVLSTEPSANNSVSPGSTVTLRVAGPDTATSSGTDDTTPPSDVSPTDGSPSATDGGADGGAGGNGGDGAGGTATPTPGDSDSVNIFGGTDDTA